MILQIDALALPRLCIVVDAMTAIPQELRTAIWLDLQKKEPNALLKQLSVWTAIMDQVNDRLPATCSPVFVDDPTLACLLAGFFASNHMKHDVCCFQQHLWPVKMRDMALSAKTLRLWFSAKLSMVQDRKDDAHGIVVHTHPHGMYPTITKDVFWIGRHRFPLDQSEGAESNVKCEEDVIHSILDDNKSLFYCSAHQTNFSFFIPNQADE